MPSLPVDLNVDRLHDLEVPESFAAAATFTVELRNHGEAVHVHLHLDDDLSEVATIEASNHFVDGESQRAVHVSVNGSGEATGTLKIASAYGAETRYVTVTIIEPEETEGTVEVDESLSEPQPREPDQSSEGGGLAAVADNPEFVVLVLGIAALVLATVVALVVDNVVVVGGALAVLVGVLVAIYMVLTG